MADVRDLKRRYKLLFAERATIASHDMGFDIPISTGSPAVDSFLLEKISLTNSMPAYEHLARSWNLIEKMNEDEEKLVFDNLSGCLNDHKLLLAAKMHSRGEEEKAFKVLDSLPFSWRLWFPVVFVKPGLVFLDGWKKDLRFRLVDRFSFAKLRSVYSKILEDAADVAILKYRERIHAATALIGYNFETGKEKSIEDWCFHSGKNSASLPLVKQYVEARDELRNKGLSAFIKTLFSSEETIPITSFMGLLGSKDLVLTGRNPAVRKLQDYAVKCSTPIEALLRLREWTPWLTEEHCTIISEKVTKTRVGKDIPFGKITQAYLNVPKETRVKITDSVYFTLLKKFGEAIGFLLPKKFVFFQPANMINIDNFLLFQIFNSSSQGQLVLSGEKKNYSYSFKLRDLKDVMCMNRDEAEQFLLKEFGGLAGRYYYAYDQRKLLTGLDKLDKTELLVLNTPFFESLEIADRLQNWAKVINLSSYYGAPTEISINYSYETIANLGKRYRLARFSQAPAAYNAVSYLEKLYWFEKMAKGVQFNG